MNDEPILPPLPEFDHFYADTTDPTQPSFPLFTVEQMANYARAAVLADRARTQENEAALMRRVSCLAPWGGHSGCTDRRERALDALTANSQELGLE